MMGLKLTVLSALLVVLAPALPNHGGRQLFAGQRRHVTRSVSRASPDHRGLLQSHASRQNATRSDFCALQCRVATSGVTRQADESAISSTTDGCEEQCHASLGRLQQASSFKVGRTIAIQFPSSNEVRKLRVGNNSAYDGVMFAGGLMVNGQNSFTARLCTTKCRDDHASGLISTVVLGKLNWTEVERGRPEVVWASASEVSIPHIETGAYVGPEDPRLDVIQGARFVLTNVNVEETGCRKFVPEWSNPRRMFFKPVDPILDAQPCAIQLDEVDHCSVQKNWASLVPRGSSEIFFVYSTMPFRMLKFNKQSCKASFLLDEASVADSKTPHMNVPHSLEQVHGGSRYVYGATVPEGELYFALGHTPPPEYRQVLIAVLYRQSNDGPAFSLAAVSCPFRVARRGRSSISKTIATSIIDFNNETDRALITYQTNDEQNHIAPLDGIGKWLQAVHKEFGNGLPLYCTE